MRHVLEELRSFAWYWLKVKPNNLRRRIVLGEPLTECETCAEAWPKRSLTRIRYHDNTTGLECHRCHSTRIMLRTKGFTKALQARKT